MIIWSFKGIDTQFRSTPAKHDRDIFKMAKACGVEPETEIIYHHGKPNRPAIDHIFAVDSDPTDSTVETVPVGTKKPRSGRSTTTGVSDVYGNVVSITTSPDLLSDTDYISDHSLGSDSVGSE